MFFPSWDHIIRHREVVLFTCGLMSDTTPLVEFVYQTWIDSVREELRIARYPSFSVDKELFQSMYAESTIALPDEPCHSRFVNIFEQSSRQVICRRSKLYRFYFLERVILWNCGPEAEVSVTSGDESPECSIFINSPRRENAARSLLDTCRQISQTQPIRDLCIFHHQCKEVSDPDVFNISQNAVSVKLEDVKFPDDVINQLVSKLNSCATLSMLDFNHTSLHSVASLKIHKMTSLLRLDLSYTNMSRQLIDDVCDQLKNLVGMEKFNISWNTLSDKNGCQIAEAVKYWPDFLGISLWRCKLSAEICGQIFAALSSRSKLKRFKLGNNTLTGSVENLISGSHLGLPHLEWFHVMDGRLSVQDLQHVGNLIKLRKLPNLLHLSMARNDLHKMEKELKIFIQDCVANHQRELTVYLSDNDLSDEFRITMQNLCQGTQIKLMF